MPTDPFEIAERIDRVFAELVKLRKSRRSKYAQGLSVAEQETLAMARALLRAKPVILAAIALEDNTEAWTDREDPLFAAVREYRKAEHEIR